MIWVWAGIGWIGCAWLIALCLGEIASPKTEVERRMDDETQIAALREYNRKTQAKLAALDKLKTEIPGGEV